MNFGFLLGLCLFNFINAKYLLVNVDDEQQVRGPKPPAPVLVTKPPVAPKRPLPTCIQPGGKCLGKTKLSINIEFSARSVKGPAECCQGYTCVSGMCLKPRISLDGLGKKVDIGKDPSAQRSLNAEERSNTTSPEGSGVFPVILCRKHQETCGLGGFVGDCCDGLMCERNFGTIGLPGKCVKAQIEDQCYFQYGFGSRMVPCCFNIISREEYDRLVEEHAKNPIVGGAIGKHHSCPKNAEEAHQIVSASELELPSLCRAHFDTCGYEATNPQKQHGDCCVGMKCERAWLEEVGKCVIGKCKNHGEKCGRQAILNAKDYGKCCEGSICQAKKTRSNHEMCQRISKAIKRSMRTTV